MNEQRTRAAIALGLLLVLLGASLGLCQSSPPWAWGPVLGAFGEDRISITWKTSRPVGFDLHYGLAQVYDATGAWEETLVFERHEGVAEIWLQNLLPGMTYRYQLVCYEGDAVYPTEVGSFTTIPIDIRSLAFAAYGATRSYPDRHKLVADAIAREGNLDVVFHAGELVEEATEERFDNLLWAIGDLARFEPYLPVIGGRDDDGGLYYDFFSLPKGGGQHQEQWWSFDLGDLHIIGLDSTVTGAGDEETLRSQTAWLTEDLQAASGKLVIVLCSNPLYSASYPTGRNEALCTSWESLFASGGVDLVVSSAVHGYEHLYRYGVHHVITGGGGAPLAEPPDALAAGTVFRRYGALHYIRGTFADGRLLIEAIPVAFVGDDDAIILASGDRSIDSFIIENLP